MGHILRRAWSRHLGLLLVALVMATGTVSFTRIIVAHATTPPGDCLPSENGQEKRGLDGRLYRCIVVGGRHAWVWVGILGMTANANNAFVSAELGYGGDWYAMLRARAGSLGPWEEFALGNLGDGTWTLVSRANNLAVSAEFGYGGGDNGMLRARASDVQDWERFYLYSIGSQFAFQSFLPPGSPCCYVSTEMGYGGAEAAMLRARATAVAGWELYNFYFFSEFPASAAKAPASSSARNAVAPPKFNSVAATCRLPSGSTVSCRRLVSFV